MADDDASGRFDKQNERGGETSAEGKSTGLFVVLWQGRTNCWLRARIISCIGCVHRYTLIEKVVSRESCKKLRFKRPRFTLEKLTLRSYRNRREFEGDEGEGKFAYKRKCSLFIFVSHAERKWSFVCFNSISLWENPLWGGTPSRGEGDGFSRPRKRSQFVAATSLQRLLKFSHCYCKTFTI